MKRGGQGTHPLLDSALVVRQGFLDFVQVRLEAERLCGQPRVSAMLSACESSYLEGIENVLGSYRLFAVLFANLIRLGRHKVNKLCDTH